MSGLRKLARDTAWYFGLAAADEGERRKRDDLEPRDWMHLIGFAAVGAIGGVVIDHVADSLTDYAIAMAVVVAVTLLGLVVRRVIGARGAERRPVD